MNELVTINKPRLITPLQAIGVFKKKFPQYNLEKVSYAGRLDPMADGLLLLLIDEQNKKRSEFESFEKTYEFKVLLGIETDTYDILGIVTKVSPPLEDSLTRFTTILPSFIGEREQAYPPYSSMHVNGKPLYYWARAAKLDDIQIPTKKITISSLEILSTSFISSHELIASVSADIMTVQGDFRQKEIIEKWQKIPTNHSFPIITCRATVSSGTYIRSLAHELGKVLQVGGIAYSITRTAVGKWRLEDAVTLT